MLDGRNKPHRSSRRQRDGGYLLLAILLMLCFMAITVAYVVGPAVVQQLKRDREEEMIHRGTQYARAIQKFYKKNGRYPSSLDDLDKGQIRFLRQRYKDPLTKDGKWKLLHYGDIQTLLNAAAPGIPAGALGGPGGAFTPGGGAAAGGAGSAFGSQAFGSSQQVSPQQQFQQQGQQYPGATSGFPTSSNLGQQYPGATAGFSSNSDQGSNPEGVPSNSSGFGSSSSANGQQGSSGGNQPGGIFGQSSTGNTTFGGGAVVGVASVSKDPTIRIYNKKKKYDEWQFIYNPMMEQPNVLLRGPYQPTTIGSTNIGTPASQLNGQQQQNGFGQQNNGFGQPGTSFGQPTNSGFGQQSPQQLQPGSNGFPPEQNQQQ